MMKHLDSSPQGIFDISWSPDGKWLAYATSDDEVRLAQVETGEIRIIGKGRSPQITEEIAVVLERADEIIAVTGAGVRPIVSKKDIVKDTPKRDPLLSPDGKKILFYIGNVFDKLSQTQNAYPYRNFLAIAPLALGKPIVTREQWYGGSAAWFPDGTRFAHSEFDSTGGPQIHILSAIGEHEGKLVGLFPSISPDGSRLAARPRGGGSLVVYSSKGSWSEDQVEAAVLRIPPGLESRASGTPPIWLDNRFALVEEGGRIWRIDTKRDKAEEMKKLPEPTARRKHSMAASPNRDLLAIEVAEGESFELRVLSIT